MATSLSLTATKTAPLGTLATTTAGVSTTTAAPSALTGAGASVAASAAAATAAAPKITYKQLEEQINKWSLELEQQERIFLQQAEHVSAWDRSLMQNGDKIIELNGTLDKVKAEQSALEHELDFIASQQGELDEMLKPLEEAVRSQGASSMYEHHADVERENTYQLAEDVDAQLKRMMQDLTEVIHHVNQSNTGQGASSNSPMNQLARVLNAHMDSLQWIDDNTAALQRKLEDVRRLSS